MVQIQGALAEISKMNMSIRGAGEKNVAMAAIRGLMNAGVGPENGLGFVGFLWLHLVQTRRRIEEVVENEPQSARVVEKDERKNDRKRHPYP